MKILSFGLLPKVVVAIVLGIVSGLFFPDNVVRFFLIINSLFGNFFSFIIPLLILGLITAGIANLGANAGKLLLLTVILGYCSTLLSGMFTFFACDFVYPLMLGEISLIDPSGSTKEALKPYFTVEVPQLMSVMSALVLAFVLGFGISAVNASHMKGLFEEFRDIINKIITAVIIPLLPLYIFTIFMNITNSGQVGNILEVFMKIIVLIFALTIIMLLLQFLLAGFIGKKNPLTLFRNMLPAYFTALGTQSSAATIPVTLEQTIKNGVNPELAGFVIPLCATINMTGSTVKIVACAMAIMMTTGTVPTFSLMAGFIVVLSVTMVAAPGVPGGAIMAALGVLASILGFDDNMLGLMVALYIVMDSFGTAANVTGDGAIAVIINRIYDAKKVAV